MAATNNSEAGLHDAWAKQAILCVAENMNANFRGVWYGDNPFNFYFPGMLGKIVLVSIVSRLLHFLLSPLKQPRFVCYVLGGILLGPSFLGRYNQVRKTLFPPRENELLLTLSIMGGIYAVFLIGVKMDAYLVVRSAKSSWRIGIAGYIFPTVASTVLMLGLVGQNVPGVLLRGPFVLYVPISLAYTFFPVLAHALEELGLLNSELGQLAMSSAVLNDILFWFLLGFSIIFKQKTTTQSVQALGSFLVLVVFSFTYLRRTVLNIVKKTPEGKPVKELYIVAVQLGVLIMASVASFVGAPSILGALLLGFIIPSGPPLGSAVVQKTELIVSEFLLPMFFVQIGYSVDVRVIEDWPSFVKLQIVIVGAYVAKFVGTVLAALSCKVRFKSAVILGLIMSIRGILELIHYHRWKASRYIDDQTYTQLILSTIGLSMIVTPLIRLLCTPHVRLDPSHDLRGLRTMRSMARNGEFRVLCCVHGEENVHGLIALLESFNPSLSTGPICAYIVQISELAGLAAPLVVPYDRRRRKLKLDFSAATDQIVRAFENYSRNSRGPVIIMPFVMVASYKTMHESVSRLAQDKFVPLVIVPFHRSHQYGPAGGGSAVSASLKQFNLNVRATAPCTVGIFVDRGLSWGLRMAGPQFTHHVAVVFIGGPDDREALALAGRMADHQSQVTITVVRILFKSKKIVADMASGPESEEVMEAVMDEVTAEEFRLRIVGNTCATWREIEVEDAEEALNVVRTVELVHFDLVIVGRRQSLLAAVAEAEEEMMSEFMENEELGVIGDMLTTSGKLSGKTASVLVLQHHMRIDPSGIGRSTQRNNSAKSAMSKSTA